MINERLAGHITTALGELGITLVPVVLERPGDIAHGDWASNVAMAAAKKAGKNPRAFAEEIKARLEAVADADVAAIEIAGPGFINVRLSQQYFERELEAALAAKQFGDNKTLKGKKVVVEYTDPNPFKEFHIGHLMSNTVGESIARLVEASGADTRRACYQGDVGLHVATALWAIQRAGASDWEELLLRGGAYAAGSKAFREDEQAKKEILEINKKLYLRSNEALNAQYDQGRANSLALFEAVYRRLGTSFDYYFFESKTGQYGKAVVESHPEIFAKSDGAFIYEGDESMGLHTRVFINKEGLPTYEAKELGLAKIKYDTYPYDISIVITGNEVNDYFKVLLDAMAKVFPDLAARTEHYSHGMLRLPTGKMSSRTGDVITAESLINDTKEKARAKIKASSFSDVEKELVAEQVSIGAIKYSILRQAAGKDIIFDFEQSLSFEGDSGPYLQYTHARMKSLLNKAEAESESFGKLEEISTLHKHLLCFPEVVLRAQTAREPHHVATYLIELARQFNAFYAANQVIGSKDESAKLALVLLASRILARGLLLLGIAAPERM